MICCHRHCPNEATHFLRCAIAVFETTAVVWSNFPSPVCAEHIAPDATQTRHLIDEQTLASVALYAELHFGTAILDLTAVAWLNDLLIDSDDGREWIAHQKRAGFDLLTMYRDAAAREAAFAQKQGFSAPTALEARATHVAPARVQ